MIDSKMEEIVMMIVSFAGEGRSYAFEAIRAARKKDFSLADQAMEKCSEVLIEANNKQTELIQAEIQGKEVPISLLLIHAQDHLMNALLAKDLAQEIIDDKKESN